VTDAGGTEPSFVQNVTAVDGFAYGVIGADLHVLPDRGPVYLLAEHRPPQELDSERLVAQPSRMLNARYAVVDFTGRRTEQAELTAWLHTGSRLAARWLHAPGGQGKTRLAAELAFHAAAAGWKVAVATHVPGAVHPPPGSQDLRPGGAAGLLLLVDYADRWPLSHLTWLFSNALFHQEVPTRLLLLARSAHLWSALQSTLEDHQADVSDQLLPPLPAGDETGERAEMFAVARKNFAARYGITDPSVIARIAAPGPLESGAFDITLAVHAAALVAVDAHARHVRPPTDPADLTAYLLKRERRGWTRLYENRLEGLDFQTPPGVMARTVFTAALTGPASHRQGREILTQLAVEGHPDRLLSDHAACYPPAAAGSVLEPLYPDRLAEDFLALSLPGHTITAYPADPWSADATALLASRDDEGIPPPYIARALTFLAAAAAPGRWQHVSAYLNSLLSTDPSLAIAGGGAALTALAEAVNIDVLEAIEAHLPSGRHVDLDLAAAAITTKLHAHRLATAPDDAERARLHANLGYRLSNASRDEEALAATAEAAEIWRRLAAAQPGTFEPHLARTLTNLGSLLSGLGRREEALAPTAEAAEIWRRLAAAQPGTFEPDLASLLTTLAARLSTLGRREEAQEATAEAIEIWRRLKGQPGTFQPDLASLLTEIGNQFSELRQPEEALAATAQAAEIRRRLAAVRPEAFEPDLAASLTDLGLKLAEVGRREEAVASAAEAAEIYRRLAAIRPETFEPDLARTLTNLGSLLSGRGRREEALAATAEAAQIYRRLAAIRPDAFEPDLAASLTNLGLGLSGVGRREEALAPAREAAEIRWRLAAAQPEAFTPGLAASLTTLGSLLWEAGRRDEALAPTAESAQIYGQLAAARPETFEPDLAASLTTLAARLSEWAWWEEALVASVEAAEIWRRLAAVQTEAFESGLARTLTNLGYLLTRLGRPKEALAPTAEAAEIYRRLAAVQPDAFEPDLARALGEYAWVRAAGKADLAQALTAAEEAVTRYEALASRSPLAFTQYLAGALTTLADVLDGLDRAGPAAAARRRASELGAT
jgi:Tetratricopeptide repeat